MPTPRTPSMTMHSKPRGRRKHVSLRIAQTYGAQHDAEDADRLNNDMSSTKPQESEKTLGRVIRSASSVVEATANNAQGDSVEVLDVEIWAPASYLRTRISSSSWMQETGLRVMGNRFPTPAQNPRGPRPSTAPATVKKLTLAPRPPLEKYHPPVVPSPPKPLKKTKPHSTAAKDGMHVQGKETPSPKPITQPTAPTMKASVGEPPRLDDIKRRKAAAKAKAEKELRHLLSTDTDTAMHTRLRFPPYIEPSPIPELHGTICFKGTPTEKRQRGLTAVKMKRLTVHFTGMASTPVRLAFLKAGIRVTKSPTKWTVLWGLTPKPHTFEKMNKFQRVNHFPGSGELGRKDKLYRNFREMQKLDSVEFNFMPSCFLLPEERVALRQDIAKHKGRRRYIVKPSASSCGRGIRITNNPSVFTCAKDCVVQRYITKPMTIDGFKFDLRVYVGVTSYAPLRVYLYDDGLVRFATKSYTSAKDDLDNRYVHITNTSVNRRNEAYVRNRNADATDCGSKWSLAAFRAYITKHRIVEWSHIWTQIHAIVAKTFLCVEGRMREHLRQSRVPFDTSCFEILGFDILIDAGHRAWLLEVNTFPDLSGSSPLDQKLKTELIEDMMHMIGIVPRGATCSGGATTSTSLLQGRAELERRGGWEAAVSSEIRNDNHTTRHRVASVTDGG